MVDMPMLDMPMDGVLLAVVGDEEEEDDFDDNGSDVNMIVQVVP